jgi:Rho termination factor, N-terminal domain
MFYWLHCLDAVLCPIEWTQRATTRIQPYAQSTWQVVTAEKTQRVLRAIGMAVLVMGTIVLCGMLEVGRLAVREATIAFRAQLGMTVAKSNAAATTEGRQLGKEALISCQTGVRQLRRVATQRGVRNAGRMRKPELLAVLELA